MTTALLARRLLIHLASLFALVSPVHLFAQADLYQHVWWDATGTRQNQQWGFAGLDTLGRIDDTIPHADAIGEITGSYSTDVRNNLGSLVYNRFKLDTVSHFHFPGRDVIRARFNDDQFYDVLCIDPLARKAHILFGTAKNDSFFIASTLQLSENSIAGSMVTNTVCVYDLDSDGHDDVVFSNLNYLNDSGSHVGRLFMFRGGDSFDTVASATLTGNRPYTDYVGGALMTGSFLQSGRSCMAEARVYGPNAASGHYDTLRVFFYPASRVFQLTPTDTLTFVFDSSGTQAIDDQFRVSAVDIDGDGRSEILVKGPSVVYAFRTDAPSGHFPSFAFHRPFLTNSAAFGTRVIDIGAATRNGYRSILISDPEAQNADAFGGAVFLYNIGRGLKDSCVAWAAGHGFEAYMGTQVIAVGDVDKDGRSDFIVAKDGEIALGPDHVGELVAFLGNDSYGPPVSVRQFTPVPQTMSLTQNYPNPASTTTDITLAVNEVNAGGAQVTLKLFDILGREVATLFSGTVDGFGYTVRVNTSGLFSGTYVYRLQCGANIFEKRMCIVH